MRPTVRYAGQHAVLFSLAIIFGVAFPIVSVGFYEYTASFYVFRAAVTHEYWWDIVCSEWRFGDSGITLIYRVNGVRDPPCASVPGYISFGKDVALYTWRVDTWTTVLIISLGSAVVILAVAALFNRLSRVVSVVKILHTLAGIASIIIVSSGINVKDQMRHVFAHVCRRFQWILTLGACRYDGNSSQDVYLGTGLYILAASPFLALVRSHHPRVLCVCMYVC